MKVNESPYDDWVEKLNVNNTIIKFKLDSGAQCNVLPLNGYQRLQNRPRILPTKAKLTGYGEAEIAVKGRCIVTIHRRNQACYVVETN